MTLMVEVSKLEHQLNPRAGQDAAVQPQAFDIQGRYLRLWWVTLRPCVVVVVMIL